LPLLFYYNELDPVRQFGYRGIWYNQNSKKTENDLSKEDIAFLKELDELIMKTK
jgi:hypothetical protein